MMSAAGRKRSKPIPPGRDWALRIREARDAKGLSQEALATAIGKTQSTIGEYEGGKTEPNVATFEAMAGVLGVSAAFLAFGKPSDSDTTPGIAARGDEENRLFAWTLHRVAKMLAEEGLDGDLAYLVALTRKLTESAKDGADDTDPREFIARALEIERAEFRQRMDEVRKNRL